MIPPRYVWPCDRFGLLPEALFNDLHPRFNTTPMFIQDFDSFYADVNAVALEAESLADLYKRLEVRRDQRLGEVREAIEDLKNHENYWSAFTSKDFGNFRGLMRYATLGHLVRFIASLLESTNRTPIPSPSRSPSPLGSEDAMTQPEPDEIMGIGPEYSSEWSWETSAQREKRMRAEGKVIPRQAPTENTVHPEIKAQYNQDDAENGTITPRHNIQKLDRQRIELVKEPQHSVKKTIKTIKTTKMSHATVASQESQIQGHQTTSKRAHPLYRVNEAGERERDKKRKRAIDEEHAIETQAQPNGESSPRRRVKARKGKSTVASTTAERPRPRRSARLSSSK